MDSDEAAMDREGLWVSILRHEEVYLVFFQSVEYTGVEKRESFIDIHFGHIVPHHSITPRIHVPTFTIKNHPFM